MNTFFIIMAILVVSAALPCLFLAAKTMSMGPVMPYRKVPYMEMLRRRKNIDGLRVGDVLRYTPEDALEGEEPYKVDFIIEKISGSGQGRFFTVINTHDGSGSVWDLSQLLCFEAIRREDWMAKARESVREIRPLESDNMKQNTMR